MKHQPYLPASDMGKANWLAAFALALADYATTLGLSAGQLAAVQADALFFKAVVNHLLPYHDYLEKLTAYKNELRDGSVAPIGDFPKPPDVPTATAVPAGVINRNTELVKAIKANPAYNETMGKALGIIGAEIVVDFGTIKPSPKAELKNGHAYIKWHHEETDGVDIKADYGDGAGFVFVGRITKAHFLDAHLPPAGQSKVFRYILQYVVNDELVGLPCDPVSITVTA